jgi:uncharacterized protein (DUF488 family)
MKEIFTIGHSSHDIEVFLELLKQHRINCIADVRSMPYSQYTPQFNTEGLTRFLKRNGILYIFFGRELGARQDDSSLYTPEGFLDFEKVSKTKIFQTSIERLKIGIDKGFRVALMCSEKDPIDCHRNIMVAREFYKNDYSVNNILYDGNLQSQEIIEKRLLDMYFPDRMQPVLFDLENKSEADLIIDAYKLRNRDIGYYINGKESDVI